jgi:hypothetical protein
MDRQTDRQTHCCNYIRDRCELHVDN